MNKSQLVETLAKEENLLIKTAEEVVTAFFKEMEECLTSGSRLEIRGLGSFKIKHYDGYNGRNPKTGKVVKVPSKKVPFFKAGKDLKERVDTIE
jgi:integration host factor subunit beta